MEKKTLITFVGLGKPEGGGYIKTTYDFGENKHIKSSCFAEAIRQSGKFAFNEVLFVGTATSSWSSLLESVTDQAEPAELWENLYSREIEKQPLSEELQKNLHTVLEKVWQKTVRISINPGALTPKNCEDILNQYISEIFDSGKNILLDVTHSFRWMPLLLSSALQFRNAYSGPGGEKGNIEIVYGELGNDLSPVRYLDVWRESEEISDAIALFFQKFEAGPLSQKLKPYWENGGKAISSLGNCVQGHLFLPLLFDLSQEGYPPSKCLKQLKEAVNKFDENKPEWVRQTKEELENLHKLLTNGDPVQRLMKLSKLLATRKLYGQAILTLGLAAEQSVLLAYDYRKHPGYYDLERLIEDGFCKDSRFKEEFKTFRRIKDLRNFVAHGGMQHPGDFKRQPQPVNLQEQYNTAYTQQSELYNSLKNYF